MDWLQALDVGVFRFINLTLRNAAFDVIMPWFSGNQLFFPAVVLFVVLLAWKGHQRGRLCLLMLAVTLLLSNKFMIGPLKRIVDRPRPFNTVPDIHLQVGRGGSGSFPSAHAANWGAFILVLRLYYRRSLRVALPLGLTVAFSRIYVGAHYPSDVIGGFLLGAGAGLMIPQAVERLWQSVGRSRFPLWWRKLPSLVAPDPAAVDSPENSAPHVALDQHWVRIGYVLIVLLIWLRLDYLRGRAIQISGGEATLWVASQFGALSDLSKPPLAGLLAGWGMWVGGDTVFGLRCLAPVVAAVLSVLVLRFAAREAGGAAGLLLLAIFSTTPMLSVGASSLTEDLVAALFCAAVLVTGWRALGANGSTRDWLWVGLWMGLGFLSHYAALLNWIWLAAFFALWPPARLHLRRAGPWLALCLCMTCVVPVVVWNARHDWAVFSSLRLALDSTVTSPAAVMNGLDFLLTEFAALNPVYAVAMAWAAIAFWRQDPGHPLPRFLFCLGAPLLIGCWLLAFRVPVDTASTMSAIVPLYCLMTWYWSRRPEASKRRARPWLVCGLAVGAFAVVILHDTRLLKGFFGLNLPAAYDPSVRVRGWTTVAMLTAEARASLEAEGKPVFIVAGDLELASLLSFYIPESKMSLRTKPIVFPLSARRLGGTPVGWPSFEARKGDNAIFVRELSIRADGTLPPPAGLVEQFESVTFLDVKEVSDNRRIIRKLEFHVCRNLR